MSLSHSDVDALAVYGKKFLPGALLLCLSVVFRNLVSPFLGEWNHFRGTYGCGGLFMQLEHPLLSLHHGLCISDTEYACIGCVLPEGKNSISEDDVRFKTNFLKKLFRGACFYWIIGYNINITVEVLWLVY